MRRLLFQIIVAVFAVGIVIPQTVLAAQIYTQAPGTGWIDLKSTNGNTWFMHNAGDGANLEFAAKHSNGNIKWQALSLSNTGNVGIGTNSAQSTLHVKGDALFGRAGGTNFFIQTPASDVRMFASGGKPFLIPEGNVGIGTTSNITHKLTVNGTVKAREVLVTNSGWADYVLDDNYSLKSLSEVEAYINQNKHLPNIPSASEVEKNGISVGDMQRMQMEKIEELTLYVIDLQKQVDELRSLVK